MPGKNQSELSEVEHSQTQGDQQQEVRELTQTDRINRRLLVAFLQAINQNDQSNSPYNQAQSEQEPEESSEWSDNE